MRGAMTATSIAAVKHERPAPRYPLKARRNLPGFRAGKHLVLKDVAGDVDANENACVKHHGR